MSSLNSKYNRLTPQERLHHLSVPVIALTGGIATGKSTVTDLLIKEGLPVIDADRLVKRIYAQQSTKDYLEKSHPEVWKKDQIDFPALREKFFKNPKIKEEIEALIYQELPQAFHEAYKQLGNPPFVVYDVPLLFEKKLENKVDLKVLVYAPREIQLERLISRDSHTSEMAETILKQQMDIEEKRKKSDFIIKNAKGKKELAEEVQNFLRQVIV